MELKSKMEVIEQLGLKGVQIGGKGSVRKVEKRRSKREEKKRIELKKKISSINKKILGLNEKRNKDFLEWLDKEIEIYLEDLKRIDINKSMGLRYSEINKEGKKYIYEQFFNDTEKRRLLKSDIYEYINKNFKDRGKYLFENLINSIDNKLIIKEYELNLDNRKYIKEEFDRGLDFFELDKDMKIHFKEIREKYNIYLTNNIYEKEKINMYYILLRNQYDNYLLNKF